ncbi:Protein CBR-ASC-1 [Caenorhabditis briggsae]|uniref:Protein CBR-ASC-1 n=1 Tax=Caenorhabditis briggsae TaxID=6238 RepID=A8XYX5_CAEBR|nr:Protein CBR-ASC-1 [Caenorhabditis briggsae]CAP37842.1 Protein CBR-ASC-1 [Caenorhabditis briggsae]
MGKKQQSSKGGVAGRQNAMSAKNEISLADTLRKGRHECLCQARTHKLVLNCLGCGRIVCEQEGSGPCFTCGTLVCTREERETLNRGSNKSKELLAKLTANGGDIGSLKQISTSYQNATEFRNKLLEADADTERRTKVNDLQSDYSTIENSPFLSAADREALKLRREELRALREKERKKFVVSLDFDGGVVQEMTRRNGVDGLQDKNDPVIQRIMERVDEKHRIQEALHNSAVDARWNPIGFVPRYLAEDGAQHPAEQKECSDGDIIDADSLMIVSDELAAQITEEKGYVISLSQPTATFIVHGLCRFLKWPTDLNLKGPLFITAKPGSTNEKGIKEFAKKFVRDAKKMSELDFADGAVLGRAFLQECMMLDDFYDKYGSKSAIPGDGNFVLCFNAFEPLVSSIPHISTSESDIYEMDRQLKRSLTKW